MADDQALTNEEGDDAGADQTARLLVALVRSSTVEALRRALPEALPWAGFLPPADTEELLDDLMYTIIEADPPGDLVLVSVLLEQWKRNAAAYADPALYAILTNGDR